MKYINFIKELYSSHLELNNFCARVLLYYDELFFSLSKFRRQKVFLVLSYSECFI